MAKAKAKAKAKPGKTPCEGGDSELLPWTLNVTVNSKIDFTGQICFANARIRLRLEPDPIGPAVELIDQSNSSKAEARLPDLQPGRYTLFWSYLTPSDKWQTRTQVRVNETILFHQRKSSEGANPVQMGVVGLKVTAS